MAALDPRLVRHVRGVRVMLAVGVVMGLLVLVQATLLAGTAARAFGGASLQELATPLIVLAAVVAARGAGALRHRQFHRSLRNHRAALPAGQPSMTPTVS